MRVFYFRLAMHSTIYPFLLLVLILFMPESPTWLIKKGKVSEATEAMLFLYGNNPDVIVPSPSNSIETPEEKARFSDLFKRESWHPLLLCLGLMFFQQTSGINAILFYTQSIFDSTGSELLSPSDATITV